MVVEKLLDSQCYSENNFIHQIKYIQQEHGKHVSLGTIVCSMMLHMLYVVTFVPFLFVVAGEHCAVEVIPLQPNSDQDVSGVASWQKH